MQSPLEAWMEHHHIKQHELAAMVGIRQSGVSPVVRGLQPLVGKLRAYVNEVAPGIAEAQDAYCEDRRRELRGKLEAA